MSITSNISPTQWVNELTGAGVSISNVVYNGAPASIGHFSTGAGIGKGTSLIFSGVMLSTARCEFSSGPNLSQGFSDDLQMPGDTLLSRISGARTYDAAILEFDFVPQSDTVKFTYIFGSEEYPEYVCSQFNDLFAFILSSNFSSPPLPPTNIALIPGTTNPVAINNVNAGQCGTFGSGAPAPSILTNDTLFVDNGMGTTTSLDGFTAPLVAYAVVQPCVSYHLRISIADASDPYFDSSVFLKGESLTSATVISAGPDRYLCPGDTVSLGIPAANGWSYTWAFCPYLSSDSVATPYFVMPNGTGPITCQVTGTNGTCGFSDDAVIYPLSADFRASVEAQPVCEGQPINIYINGAQLDTAEFMWDFDGGTVLSGSGAGPYSVLYPSAGTYQPSVQISSKVCLDTLSLADSGLVTINPLPVASAVAYDNVCPGTQATLLGGSTIVSGSIQSNTWYFGDGASAGFLLADHVYSQPGVYTATFQTVSDNGCSDAVSLPVRVLENAQIDIVPDAAFGCVPMTVRFSDESSFSGQGSLQQVWHFSNGDTLTGPDVSTSFYRPGDYDVHLQVTAPNGCISETTMVDYIHVDEMPHAGFSLTAASLSDSITVITMDDRSYGSTSWRWDFGDGQTSFGTDPIHTYTEPGYYAITQWVSNDFGCTDSIVHYVKVYPEISLWVPSAFTPNGDGRNDVFYVEATGTNRFKMSVFDRWGLQIFTTTDRNIGWDGTYKGGPCQQDAYDYLIEYDDRIGYLRNRTGKIMLIR
jgi:gliding motility-associated-like protein